MFSFRDLAARIIDRARGDLERDLQARAYPDVTPIPMSDWLAQLDNMLGQLDQVAQAANLAAAVPFPDDDEPDTPRGDRPEDDGMDPADGFYEDFDRRR